MKEGVSKIHIHNWNMKVVRSQEHLSVFIF